MNGPIGQDDAYLTEILGEKCPACGYRRGLHRPEIRVGAVHIPACSHASARGGAA